MLPKKTTAPEGDRSRGRRNRRYGRIGLVAASRLGGTASRFGRGAAGRFTGGLAATVVVEQPVQEALEVVQRPRTAATRGRSTAGRFRLAASRLGSTASRLGRLLAAAGLGGATTVAVVAQQAFQQPGFSLGSRTQHQADQHKSGQYETLGHGVHSCTQRHKRTMGTCKEHGVCTASLPCAFFLPSFSPQCLHSFNKNRKTGKMGHLQPPRKTLRPPARCAWGSFSGFAARCGTGSGRGPPDMMKRARSGRHAAGSVLCKEARREHTGYGHLGRSRFRGAGGPESSGRGVPRPTGPRTDPPHASGEKWQATVPVLRQPVAHDP